MDFAAGKMVWHQQDCPSSGSFRLHRQLDDRVMVLKLLPGTSPEFLSFFGIPLSLYHIPEDMEFLDYPYENSSFRFITTPGHTKGGVSILWKDNGILFSGDTLFQMGEGRSDLGGDRETLMASIRKLSLLPPETIVLPGHGGRTTIGREARRLGFTQP